MCADTIKLREFYSTELGIVAQRCIMRRLRLLWGDVQGLDVLGLGFASPFLNAFRNEANTVIAMMPGPQGAEHWPSGEPNLTALVNPADLPLADRSVHRVLLIHALECTEHVRPMMREVWRVLTDGGRLIIVVPNRRGLWTHFNHTPFGGGRPYSAAQLTRRIRDWMFSPFQMTSAIFIPPLQRRLVLASANVVEEIGERWLGPFAGVILFEATKQIYGAEIVAGAETPRVYAPVASR